MSTETEQPRGCPDPLCEDGWLVHPPTEFDQRVGESRRLHTRCPHPWHGDNTGRQPPSIQDMYRDMEEERNALQAEVERLRGAIEKALNVPGTDCHQHHLVEGRVITFVTPRDSRVVLTEIRAALRPASTEDTGDQGGEQDG